MGAPPISDIDLWASRLYLIYTTGDTLVLNLNYRRDARRYLFGAFKEFPLQILYTTDGTPVARFRRPWIRCGTMALWRGQMIWQRERKVEEV